MTVYTGASAAENVKAGALTQPVGRQPKIAWVSASVFFANVPAPEATRKSFAAVARLCLRKAVSSSPSSLSALRFVTFVVLATTSGAVPVA